MKCEKIENKYVNLCVDLIMPGLNIRAEDLIAKAKTNYKVKTLGYNSAGFEDGEVAEEFYRCCKSFGIKPVIGASYFFSRYKNADFKDKRLLFLFAINSAGYDNLSRMRDILRKSEETDYPTLNNFKDGLLCVYRVNGNYPDTEEIEFNVAREIFQSNLYVCCQRPEQVDYARAFAAEHGVKAVVFDTVKYADGNDYKEYLKQRARFINNFGEKKPSEEARLIPDDYYIKTYSDMIKKYPTAGDLIENTVEITEKCNPELNFK